MSITDDLNPDLEADLLAPLPTGLAGASPEGPEGGDVSGAGSAWRLTLRAFFDNRLSYAGLAILIVLVLFSFVGPLVYHSDLYTATYNINLPPGPGHPLGTDSSGRDVLGRLMVGGQASLIIGVLSAVISTVIGVIWGAVSGFFGGLIDTFLMRIVDVLLAVPTIFILLYLASIFRPTVLLLSITIAILSWLGAARLVRGETLSLRSREFVRAVQVMGGSRWRIIRRHIIPNTISVVVVQATFQVANAILLMATLGFLGFGLEPPAADWGSMLSQGVNYIYDGYWWLIWPAGILIVLAVLSFNFIGDALRDAVEVRLQRR
ncbi:binding-protein-dependent transport systems inner membrane component [Acidimicrobium ferrooxidans DSM 10331]|uniref:Binding-protein-dependent transport systems inner membrane component n=1 Tax=Acidimicrobium ferrooxidans (strain DSM 10331 / JCM 15462 / NBRC 103882 / ICP) TaxID=525909 RepID=C7LZB8_ACIFD|nr:ABC transporter permease [Acidimicrobium ferrooxidans]ACU54076.1 binding-protein-dependent transport systems inner membrane component [Acidimicrobium ferrooxidans DSM 10331]